MPTASGCLHVPFASQRRLLPLWFPRMSPLREEAWMKEAGDDDQDETHEPAALFPPQSHTLAAADCDSGCRCHIDQPLPPVRRWRDDSQPPASTRALGCELPLTRRQTGKETLDSRGLGHRRLCPPNSAHAVSSSRPGSRTSARVAMAAPGSGCATAMTESLASTGAFWARV